MGDGPVRLIAVVTAAAVLAAVPACGDDGGDALEVDGPALVEPFQAEAEGAYAAHDADRSEDFDTGAFVEDGCFALDQETATTVAESLGVEDPESAELDDQGVFILGPPERERLTCAVMLRGDSTITVTIGTVPVGRDELLREADRRNEAMDDPAPQEIEGDAPGLDADHVVAYTQDDGAVFIWVHDGFAISLAFHSEVAEPEAGFEALPVLVEGVATVLAAAE